MNWNIFFWGIALLACFFALIVLLCYKEHVTYSRSEKDDYDKWIAGWPKCVEDKGDTEEERNRELPTWYKIVKMCILFWIPRRYQ